MQLLQNAQVVQEQYLTRVRHPRGPEPIIQRACGGAIAGFEAAILEGLPQNLARVWPEESFLNARNEANFSQVPLRFGLRLLAYLKEEYINEEYIYHAHRHDHDEQVMLLFLENCDDSDTWRFAARTAKAPADEAYALAFACVRDMLSETVNRRPETTSRLQMEACDAVARAAFVSAQKRVKQAFSSRKKSREILCPQHLAAAIEARETAYTNLLEMLLDELAA